MEQRMGYVLIVDDNAEYRRMVARVLHGSGYETTEAEDGAEALHQVQNRKPDIIITDIIMPKLSGIELIQVIRRRFRSVPIVAVSGGGLHTSAQHYLDVCRTLGVLEAISKPFEPAELLAAVARASARQPTSTG